MQKIEIGMNVSMFQSFLSIGRESTEVFFKIVPMCDIEEFGPLNISFIKSA